MTEKKIRVENGIVVEIVEAVKGFKLSQCYHADFLSKCIDFQGGVEIGMLYDKESGKFTRQEDKSNK